MVDHLIEAEEFGEREYQENCLPPLRPEAHARRKQPRTIAIDFRQTLESPA